LERKEDIIYVSFLPTNVIAWASPNFQWFSFCPWYF